MRIKLANNIANPGVLSAALQAVIDTIPNDDLGYVVFSTMNVYFHAKDPKGKYVLEDGLTWSVSDRPYPEDKRKPDCAYHEFSYLGDFYFVEISDTRSRKEEEL